MKSESRRQFRCSELWVGNEHAHRSVRFAGLEANIIARPSEDREGGDLCALCSCGEERARGGGRLCRPRIEEGDIVLIFSDGVTDVFSPDDEQLRPVGTQRFAEQCLAELKRTCVPAGL
jgi:hypothetical protein